MRRESHRSFIVVAWLFKRVLVMLFCPSFLGGRGDGAATKVEFVATIPIVGLMSIIDPEGSSTRSILEALGLLFEDLSSAE